MLRPIVLCVLLAGCTQKASEGWEVIEPEDQPDVAITEDLTPTEDLTENIDAPPPAPEPIDPWSLVPANYICENPGDIVESPAGFDEAFQKPPDALRGRGPSTRSQAAQSVVGVPNAGLGISTTPETAHTNPILATYHDRGEDVVIYFELMARNPPVPLYIDFVVFLDYQPVDARLTIWDTERQNVLLDKTGYHFRYEKYSDYLTFDVVLDPSHFPHDGAYDLSIHFYSLNPDGIQRMRFARKFTVFYNGYNQRPHPCITPATPEERQEVEAYLPAFINVFHRPTLEATYREYSVADPLRRTPGEVLPLEWFMTPQGLGRNQFKSHFAQPYVTGGHLIGEPMFLIRGHELLVSHRGDFEITIPSEPERVHVFLAASTFPFLPNALPDGTVTPFGSANSFGNQNSNPLFIDVIPEDAENP